MINLEWLRTFKAIYECNTITEASGKLNMTQPGVSKHLSALESHIGKELFERTTRKLIATEYGKFLYTQITNPLRELEKVERYSGKRTKKARSAITIGCTTDFFKTKLRHVIYNFDMYIVTQFGNENELIEALESEKVQLLAGIKEYPDYNHQFIEATNEELVLICSKNTELPSYNHENKAELIKWLQKKTWFVFDNDQKDIKMFWEANFKTLPKIVPRYILPSYIDIIEAIKLTNGFSIIPKHLCQKALDKNLIKMPLGQLKTVEQKLFFTYKAKNTGLEAIEVFIEKTNQNI